MIQKSSIFAIFEDVFLKMCLNFFTFIDSILPISVIKGAVVLHDFIETKISKEKRSLFIKYAGNQKNPSFWPISGNFLINLPDFCNFNRFSPVYDSCEGDSGTS